MRKMSSLFIAACLVAATHGRADAQDYQQQQYADPNQQPQYADPNAQPAAAAAPQGQYYAYVGVHPVPYDQGNGICTQEGPHFHEYAPFDQYLFRESNGYFYFVGDIGDFGYQGASYSYGGNHPIPAELGGGYCYIPWLHRHHFAPPSSQYYNYVDNYYVYTGTYDPYYYNYRDGYWGYYNGYYRTNYYGGAYWSVRPHHMYRPTVVVGRGLYATGRYVPPPIGGRWGGAQVRVVAPAVRPVYVAPARVYAPAAPRVVVSPAPHIGVGVTVGAPVHYGTPAPPAHYAPAPVVVPARRYTPPPAPVRSVPAPRHR